MTSLLSDSSTRALDTWDLSIPSLFAKIVGVDGTTARDRSALTLVSLARTKPRSSRGGVLLLAGATARKGFGAHYPRERDGYNGWHDGRVALTYRVRCIFVPLAYHVRVDYVPDRYRLRCRYVPIYERDIG